MPVGNTEDLTILLIDDNESRANAVKDALSESRYKIKHLRSSGVSLLKQVDELQPDMVVIDIESPDRDILDSLHMLSSFNPKPIVMFSETEDSDFITESVRCGVSAYVVGDTDPKRVRPILDAALARFKEFHDMKKALEETRSELAARKTVDQAKRLLMQKKQMSEPDAFHAMRKMAMDSGQKLEDVAKSLLAMLKVLP
ncbi:MAG: response regulator NasT [Glaciecola sp.]|jgi:response regulator NasT